MTATVDSATTHKDGRVVAIFGPVVDVEFPTGDLPEIYNAVNIETTRPTVRATPKPLIGPVPRAIRRTARAARVRL